MYRDQFNFKEAKFRIQSQLPIQYKKKLADKIIDNSYETDIFKEQVNKLL